MRKQVFGVSDQEQHKPGCTATGIVVSECSENKGADQLRGYREADQRLCFCICKKPVFSQGGSFDRSDSIMVKYRHQSV